MHIPSRFPFAGSHPSSVLDLSFEKRKCPLHIAKVAGCCSHKLSVMSGRNFGGVVDSPTYLSTRDVRMAVGSGPVAVCLIDVAASITRVR
jgi:hypothetical protein